MKIVQNGNGNNCVCVCKWRENGSFGERHMALPFPISLSFFSLHSLSSFLFREFFLLFFIFFIEPLSVNFKLESYFFLVYLHLKKDKFSLHLFCYAKFSPFILIYKFLVEFASFWVYLASPWLKHHFCLKMSLSFYLQIFC